MAVVLKTYGVADCAPEGSATNASSRVCCAVADGVLFDAAMRCPAHRSLAAQARHKPGAQYWYELNCCPTCPVARGGLDCVCQHTSELAYVFGTVSDYRSDNATVDCKPEPSFNTFSDMMIAAWAGIAANGSHNGAGAGAIWPSFNAEAALFYMNEEAQGGPGAERCCCCFPHAAPPTSSVLYCGTALC